MNFGQRRRTTTSSGGHSRQGGGGGRSFGQRTSSSAKGRDGFEMRPGKFIRKKVCRLCGERVSMVDYKETERLLKFLTEKGKILPQRISGNCAKHQRMLSRAVKRARHASLVPFEIGK